MTNRRSRQAEIRYRTSLRRIARAVGDIVNGHYDGSNDSVTELGRATGALDQARALSIGSNGYIWRTAEDGDVRHSHREMEGKFVEWGRPPTLDGMTGHAGELPNCRCYKEIVLPNPHSYLA
ncbi:phage minor head protein [Escherichia coli]|uniref:phage minor head protein n=1 Tax=Escherichia coli TaxID=562 RepID=UPI000DD7B2D9|nr:phage minor head protein [Escherichia coli]